jgi:NADPH:quinone reductase
MRDHATNVAITLERGPQAEIFRWRSEGPRLHTIAATFPLDATVRSHEAVETGTKRGTIVVMIA